MSLYEIASDLYTVINDGLIFDEDTGEIVWDGENLGELQATFDDKAEAVAMFVKNLEADAEAIKAEEQALKKRREVKERKADRLREYLLECLDVNGLSLVDTPKARISTRRSTYVNVTDDGKVPESFRKVKTVESIDKTAIGKALKAGDEVDGCELAERRSLQIR